MKNLLTAVCILALVGCVTGRIGTGVFTERSFTADNALVRSEVRFDIGIPDGCPDFTTHSDPMWLFKEDYLRVVGYAIEQGGEISLYSGGYWVMIWVEGDIFKPLGLEFINTGIHKYWIYDQKGVPSPASRDDYLALVEHYKKLEKEKQGGDKL
jgi:hypothetical protein